MPLITTVKMGSVNNLSDARFAAGYDVEYIGFCLDPDNDRAIDIKTVKQITDWIEGPEFIAETGSQSPEVVNKILQETGFQWAQVNENFEGDPQLIQGNVMQTLQIEIPDAKDPAFLHMKQESRNISSFIVSLSPVLIEQRFHEDVDKLSDLKKLLDPYNVLIDFPLNTENLMKILQAIRPNGINLSGEDEVVTGYRDFDELIDLLEILATE